MKPYVVVPNTSTFRMLLLLGRNFSLHVGTGDRDLWDKPKAGNPTEH